jgi:uncharacterized protein (UPF0335 family)
MIDDVIKVPTVRTVSCKAYRERIHRLEAERDRLREALEALYTAAREETHFDDQLLRALEEPLEHARAALAEGGQND